MFKKLSWVLIFLFSWINNYAQADSSHLRISLLTCGVGEEIWETFGHTGVRVIDSVRRTDVVYNYGTFNFGKDFEIQFMKGKLIYYVSVDDYRAFMQEYINAKRSVQEQEIILSGRQKEDIYAFLQNNALPQNRDYKYDFFYDNCATRIRDIFPKTFGAGFRFGQTIPTGARIPFRHIINQYLAIQPWERFGINILLGSRIDRIMSNEDIMFLPDFLRDGIGKATVNGKRVASDQVLILPGETPKQPAVNQPFLLTCAIAILTIAGLSVRRLRPLGRVMSSLLMLVTGLLGCLIIVMWLGTNHQGCRDNFSLLWCLPTNIVLAFARPKGSSRYALIAIFLLFMSLLMHTLGVQGLLLLEYSPLFLALVFVYGTIYRQSKKEAK